MSDVTRVIISFDSPENCKVEYSLHYRDTEIPEGQLFSTKEERLKSLQYGKDVGFECRHTRVADA